jgi:hypothetical protein
MVLHAHAATAGVAKGKSDEAERSTPHRKPSTGGLLFLPRGTVVPYLATSIEGTHFGKRRIDLGLGAFWGATDNLQVEAHLGPIQLGPTPGQGPHRLAITQGLVHTKRFELGGSFSVSLDTSRKGPPLSTVQPGLVSAISYDNRIWFEASGNLPVSTGSDAGIGLSVPIRANLALLSHVQVRLESGLEVKKLGETAAAVPLGIGLRYKASRALGGWSVSPYLSGTQFYTPQTGRVDTDVFSAGVVVGIPLKR